MKEHNIEAIGYPEVSITKIAKGSPLGFKLKVAVMPTITLPPYKKIAAKAIKKKTDLDVSDKEIYI